MSHGIYRDTEFGYTGQVPWHGLGKRLREGIAPMEAFAECDLDWSVVKLPAYVHFGDSELVVPHNFATVRADTGEVFGHVGDRYTILQNREQAAFISELTGRGCVVECLGALFGGRQVFWTVRLEDTKIMVDGHDEVKPYLIAVNSHDGSMAFRVFWSAIRVVCNNTLQVALVDAKDGVYIRHTHKMGRRVEEAKRVLGVAKDYYEQAGEAYQAMADYAVDERQLTQYYYRTFTEGKEPKELLEAQLNQVVWLLDASVAEFCRQVATGAKSTLWTTYNVVTAEASHRIGQSKAKGPEATPEARFHSVLQGFGTDLAKRGHTEALAVMAS